MRRSWLDRILAVADDDQPASRRIKLESLQLLMLSALILEQSQLYLGPAPPAWRDLWKVVGLSVPALLTVCHRQQRLAGFIALAVMLTIVFQGIAGQPNHYALPVLVFLVLGVLNLENERERQLALQAVRWLTALILFFTGFQKLVYGTYFHGEYLGLRIASSERFAQFFVHILSPEEFTRLRSLDEPFGGGAYRPRSLIVVAMSNMVYIIELVTPVFLLLKKTRPWALLLAVIFIALVEAGAREYYFGILFVAMLLTFAARNWIRWLVPVVLVITALSLANRLWHLIF